MWLVRRAALLFIAAIVLSACRVDVAVNVTVAPDGSGSITLVAVADPGVVVQAPGLAEDLRFEDAVAAGWTVDGPTAGADGTLTVRLAHDFATVEEATALLQSIGGPGGPLHGVALTRTVDGDEATVELTGSLRIDGGLTAFADTDLLQQVGAVPYSDQIAAAGLNPADAVGIQFAFSAPGDLVSATGTLSNGTASWTVPLDGTQLDVQTTASQSGGGESSGVWKLIAAVALVLLIGWLVVASGFIAFVVRERRRRAARRRARLAGAPSATTVTAADGVPGPRPGGSGQRPSRRSL
jgi:hypothetical protein